MHVDVLNTWKTLYFERMMKLTCYYDKNDKKILGNCKQIIGQ